MSGKELYDEEVSWSGYDSVYEVNTHSHTHTHTHAQTDRQTDRCRLFSAS